MALLILMTWNDKDQLVKGTGRTPTSPEPMCPTCRCLSASKETTSWSGVPVGPGPGHSWPQLVVAPARHLSRESLICTSHQVTLALLFHAFFFFFLQSQAMVRQVGNFISKK